MSALLKSFVVLAMLLGFTGDAKAGDTYKLDPAHSFISFRIKHMNTGWTYGRFNAPEGTVTIDGDNSKFDLSVKTANIDTGIAKRDAHLKSPDFFNAADFPGITFKSTSVKSADNKLELTGDLTLHGTTKSITLTFEKSGEGVMGGQQRVGYETSLTLKRSDYGMSGMIGPVGDDVNLWFAFEAVKE